MGNGKDNFREALHTIVKLYGSELLDDTRRANALLMDYAPGHAKERSYCCYGEMQTVKTAVWYSHGKKT